MKNIRLATLTAITLAFTAPLLPAFADDNDDIAAVQQWQSKAESGDAEAQFRIGQAYAFGQGFNQNFENAFEWYEKAAKQGHAKAQTALALLYGFGEGTTANENEAIKWLDKATTQNEPMALFFQGMMNYKKKDFIKAKEWWEKAIAKGEPESMTGTASLYEEGNGVQQDNNKALEWLQKASDTGSAEGSIRLAFSYEEGKLGLEKNDEKAFTYMERAAIQGSEAGSRLVSKMYLEGRGVVRNEIKGIKWAQKNEKLLKTNSDLILFLERLQK